MKLGYVMLMVAVGAVLMFAPAAMGAGKTGGSVVFGDVKAVDKAACTITVATKAQKDTPAADRTIKVTNMTKVVKMVKRDTGGMEEKPGTLADVTEGVTVRVMLAEDGSAGSITILPAGSTEHKGGSRGRGR